MLNVVMQSNMYNGIPKSGVALKNRSDIEVFDSKKVYKGTLVKTQAGDDEFILGHAYPTCNGSVFIPVDVNLASKHTGTFKKHLQSFGNAFMGVATKGYYDTLALGASLDGILSFDQDKRLNAMSASAEYTEEGKKANEYYKNKSQYKQAYDAYSIDINLFMAVKGIGNICKSPGNISNMGSGSLPILNGTKGTLAISSSVKIADIGVVVRTGIGGAELGLGAYNFSKGSNNGSSKETDKNNNATNKKNYEKESSSNNKGKNIENKVQGNETKGAGKALDDVVKKYSDDIYKYNYKEGVYKPTEVTTRNYDKLDEIAEEMYDSFRGISDDVEKIANNTGWDIKDINQIKEHVFLDEVLKDSGMGRLDPDYEMAMAWERLCKGEFHDNDILLLKHELYESTYYRINKSTQRQAHDITTEIFDWNRYVESLR
ncbi:hypothetical protein [Clostridium sp. CMCC3677]|uniref:hypothetical protein n=1 Tax=Clostridium sp. CMCC3677 TaxID=2949963 RepID=UPI0013F0934E|nr:hypothetical protein [Clostridium sp. CMCC3677]NFG62879.1 hypothetical protein [Clostridium botulinum]NFQ08737.1 hypothetical protein [Clostridium botulinum]